MATVLEIHVLLPCFTAIMPRVCHHVLSELPMDRVTNTDSVEIAHEGLTQARMKSLLWLNEQMLCSNYKYLEKLYMYSHIYFCAPFNYLQCWVTMIKTGEPCWWTLVTW